jgi:3-oxoadipate enol-lactonase
VKSNGFVEAKGARLYFDREGEGFQLLFIHAGVADLRMWDQQIDFLSKEFDCIRFDMRGFGRSENKAESFSHVDDVITVLDHMDAGKAHIVGLSMGGFVAAEFALEHPERVHSLVLVAAGASGLNYQLTDQEEAAFEEMERKENEQAWDELVELELQMWLDGPGRAGRIQGDLRERLRGMCRGAYERNEPEGQPILSGTPAAPRLSSISVPTLVICGTYDTSRQQAASDFIASEIPGAKKLTYEGVAHMVNLERPARFNADLMAFLNEVD